MVERGGGGYIPKCGQTACVGGFLHFYSFPGMNVSKSPVPRNFESEATCSVGPFVCLGWMLVFQIALSHSRERQPTPKQIPSVQWTSDFSDFQAVLPLTNCFVVVAECGIHHACTFRNSNSGKGELQWLHKNENKRSSAQGNCSAKSRVAYVLSHVRLLVLYLT